MRTEDRSEAVDGSLVERQAWDDYAGTVSLPARVSWANSGRVHLARHLSGLIPGDASRILEIGCAPAAVYLAELGRRQPGLICDGIDISEPGAEQSRKNLEILDVTGEVRCEDAMKNSFAAGSYDFVYSLGVIEHFQAPGELIGTHFNLLKPGGRWLITVPNFDGVIGHFRDMCEPGFMRGHNAALMSRAGLELACREAGAEEFTVGRSLFADAGSLGLDRAFGRFAGRALFGAASLLSYVFPSPAFLTGYFYATGCVRK